MILTETVKSYIFKTESQKPSVMKLANFKDRLR